MRFSEIKRFAGTTLKDVIDYMPVFASGLRDLFAGLYQLDILENFQSFSWTGTLAPGVETSITNALATIPRFWVIVDATGDRFLVRGNTVWNSKTLSLRNTATLSTFTGTVVFFR